MSLTWKIITFFILCGGIGLGVGIIGGTKTFSEKMEQVSESPLLEKIVPQPYKPITITFVGDIMMDRGVERSIEKNFGGDYFRILSKVAPLLSTSDITFGNVEGPVTTKGPDVGSKYSFQMDPLVIPALKQAGFDIVSFANNHVGDRSIIGFSDTLANFAASKLLVTGAGLTKQQAEQPTIVSIEGKKIGFLGFTDVGPNWLSAKESSPGILLLSDPRLETIIKNAKNQVDVLFISVHWGVEYVPATTRQKTFAHNMINWGADAIIGHHPHVIQETEWYDGKFIAYSLGNFIFDQYFSDATLQGLVVNMQILENNQLLVDKLVVEMDKKYQPLFFREPFENDYVIHQKISEPVCPRSSGAEKNLWLAAVGPDLEIGDYIPKSLVLMTGRIDVRGPSICLNESAALALEKMFHTMEDLQLKPVMSSGFRTREVQQSLYAASTTTQESLEDPAKYPSVAKPGTSEHQLGTAVDMRSATSDDFSLDGFKQSDEYRWLNKHAHEYGFVQSYKPGAEAITGYIAEPWHWRYVGIEHATEIKNKKISPYEYLQSLAK